MADRYITAEGLARIRAEYEDLFGVERPKVVETVSWAASLGDRSENADYIYGKRRLREIDRRLGHLAKIMKQAKVVDKHVRARRADGRDAEVGRRVRSRRLECRLSQTELADRIGVTFQQVQKYEKGVNRIGAGRLQRISEALEVPISFFFGGPGSPAPTKELNGGAESVFGFLQTSGSVRIVKAFHKIRSRKARQLLVEMAEELADAQGA